MQFYILSIFLFNEVSTDWCVVGRKKMDAIKNIFMWSDYYLINMFAIYNYINKSLQNSAASNNKDIWGSGVSELRESGSGSLRSSCWLLSLKTRRSTSQLISVVVGGLGFSLAVDKTPQSPAMYSLPISYPSSMNCLSGPYNMAAGFSQNKYPNGERKKNTLILEMTYHHFHSNLFYPRSESLNPAYTQKEGMTHE